MLLRALQKESGTGKISVICHLPKNDKIIQNGCRWRKMKPVSAVTSTRIEQSVLTWKKQYNFVTLRLFRYQKSMFGLLQHRRARPMQAYEIIFIAPLSQITVWGLNQVGRPQRNAKRNSLADQAPGKQPGKQAFSLPHTSSFICRSEICQEPLRGVGNSWMHFSPRRLR